MIRDSCTIIPPTDIWSATEKDAAIGSHYASFELRRHAKLHSAHVTWYRIDNIVTHPDTLQAAIAAVHAELPSSDATDWAQIVALYDVLAQWEPSPVVELNRAVAVAMHQGSDAGLALIEEIFDRGELLDYHLAHSARAELCRRLGKPLEARVAYERALALTQQEPERRFLKQRLRELGDRDAT